MRTHCWQLSFALIVASSFGAIAAEPARDAERPLFGEGVQLFSDRAAASFKSGAAPDSFCLYGGPGSLEGKFQLADKFTPDAQGWTTHDVTDLPTMWQLHSFNSPTGTQCMWAGQTAAQQPGWNVAPGYGNGWDESLVYRRQVSDPSVGQVVDLSFVFNHDVEPSYDWFRIEYESGGGTIEVYSVTGYNKPSHGSPIFTPLNYPADTPSAMPIVYFGNDYVGDGNDEIIIRMRVTSDGAWSDADGLWPSDGAAQVDDVTVVSSEGTDFDDFNVTNLFWIPDKKPFAGDFGKVFARFHDLDPCRENTTPLIGFLDDGTPPNNPDYVGPGTGGTTSVNWNYGLPGGWVVNYNGGVSFGELSVANEWWSPEIDWDLPGTADDGVDVVGAVLRFSIWPHASTADGIRWDWAVRSHDGASGSWDSWRNRGSSYYGGSAEWRNLSYSIGDLIEPGSDKMQVKFHMSDVAEVFAFPGTDATPAPMFDNVTVLKYGVGGPSIFTREIDLFADSFANSGGSDVSTQASRDLLDCRVDMVRDVSQGTFNRPGDSLIVDVSSVIPGVAISNPTNQISLHYRLSMNPFFEAAIRGNAPPTETGTGSHGWDVHAGNVAAKQSTTAGGTAVQDRYFFDLPDENFFYPGDVLQYYIEAVDDDGRTTTLPADISQFGNPGPFLYSRVFTIQALPTYYDSSGGHPEILYWNDFGHGEGEAASILALRYSGLEEGIYYDRYTTRGGYLVSQGLGSTGAHGASAAQLAGYSCLIYESGDESDGLLSDGSDGTSPGGSRSDKSDDVGLILQWFEDVSASRSIVHFGDDLASYLAAGSAAQQSYLANVMNVQLNDGDVFDEIGNQTAPHVLSTGALAPLSQDYVAYGGCFEINRFDSIQPGPGAVSTHGYEIFGSPGVIHPGASAAVAWEWTDAFSNLKQSASFPYSLDSIRNVPKTGPGARADLLGQVLAWFGHTSGILVPAPARPHLVLQRSYPNPFNPSTTLRFSLGREAMGSIRVYNLRGELVRALRDGVFEAGSHELQWNGCDDDGAVVASGVYVARFEIDGLHARQKLVMLK